MGGLMKLTRSTYPESGGSPCWTLRSRWLYADLDVNTRPPFGACMCAGLGQPPGGHTPGFTLDVNAPLGEPNRLYLWIPGWSVTLGLPEFRDFRVTGRETTVSGKRVVHGEHFTNWLRPHIAGISRYRYHQDAGKHWVRDDKPAPGHWGWLTVERSRCGRTGKTRPG